MPKRGGKKQSMFMYVRKDGFVGNGGEQTGKEKKVGSYGEKKVMAKSHILCIYLWKGICRTYSYMGEQKSDCGLQGAEHSTKGNFGIRTLLLKV